MFRLSAQDTVIRDRRAECTCTVYTIQIHNMFLVRPLPCSANTAVRTRTARTDVRYTAGSRSTRSRTGQGPAHMTHHTGSFEFTASTQ